jgi:hypothetical protein
MVYQHDFRPKPKLIVILPPTRNLILDLTNRLRSHLSIYASMYTYKHRPKYGHTHIVYRRIHIEDVSKMLGQTSGASSPTAKQENEFTSANSCRGTAQKCVDLNV